jgi:pyrroline-5-carboxylate reductase
MKGAGVVMSGPDRNSTVGFIGVGDMGSAIAGRIIDGGFQLMVYDVRAEAVAQLTRRGATAATSPSALASACSLVFICVVDDRQVIALVRDHLASALQAGSVVVIVSSVRPETMLEAPPAWQCRRKCLGFAARLACLGIAAGRCGGHPHPDDRRRGGRH